MKKILLFILPLLFCAFISNAQFSISDAGKAMRLIDASKTSLGLTADDLGNVKITNTYTDNNSGITYVYLIQTYQGIPVYNQMLILAFKNDKMVSNAGVFNHSVEKLANMKTGIPSVPAESAVQSALSERSLRATQMAITIKRNDGDHKIEFGNMGVSRENITAQLMWVPIEELLNNVPKVTTMKLAWQVYIMPKTTPDLWLIRIDATDNSFLGKTNLTEYDNWGTPSPENTSIQTSFDVNNLFDFKEIKSLSEQMPAGPTVVNSALYRVIPFPAEAPSFPGGTPATRTDPWNAASAVPNAITLKWHTGAGPTDYAYSRGNNVWAYEDRTPPTNTGTIAKSANSTTPLPNLTFDFVPNFTVTPLQTTPVQNQQFNITNLFYWVNLFHDVMYIYGFTEAAANFQDDNMGRGGAGNDHVNAEAQDASGTNNANFGTPPDGGSGQMQMYLWNGSPQLDGDVDNGVIMHEHGHGLSNRLTGGGYAGCLTNAEQMGEGWSDYYALMFTQNWATSNLNTGFTTPRGIGTYVLNQPPTGLGIRSQRYCTDFAVNNKVYLTVLPPAAVPHDRGEIWCATLWDMTWNIINQVGVINPNLYDLAGGGGNNIAMKLVTEGMKLQRCGPGFISGRNAILLADQALYGGTYSCAIWEAFRRRGMGAFASEGSTNATNDQTPDFTPPITFTATVSAVTIGEGQNLTYTNTVTTCAALSGYTLRDTLPANVTYVSGGTYDAVNRVVSFPVNQGAGTTNYSFIVTVNMGSYFPTVTLFNDAVGATIPPATWSTSSTTSSVWASSTARFHSAPSSYYSVNTPVISDQRIFFANDVAIPATAPDLTFWHYFNTEGSYDGGTLEVSTNGGGSYTQVLNSAIVSSGYTDIMDPSTLLAGQQAWTGGPRTSGWERVRVPLTPYAGQNIKLRWRSTTDLGSNSEGWYIDDIAIKRIPIVYMRSSLFNGANARVFFKDMETEITQFVACAPVVNTHPANVTTCAASTVNFSCTGAATGGVTYQWQESTGGPFANIINGGVYSGATTSTLTLTGVTIGMSGRQYRCVVTGTCPPDAISNPATLTVLAASIGGTVNPANTSVCGTTNFGTLTLSGHTGSVVRWESATVLAGPYTPISNTTTTLNFTNLTQTTYFRAVVLVPGCIEANSSIATVTFSAANAMTIVAVPGTTLCQGDPAALTVMESGGVAPVTVTHSSSNTITAGNSVSCGTAITTADNSFWRVYDLATFPAVTGNFTINTVTFAVELSSGGPQNVTVRLYTQTGGAFPGGTRTQIASQVFSVPNLALATYTATLGTPVTVPNSSVIVVEVETAGAVNTRFFIGSNAAAETGPTYLSAAACAIAAPTTTAAIGFPNMHAVLSLSGTVAGVGGIVTGGTFLWSPAPGLSSTTTNPVAASPAATTTYTVSHNNGAGCIRQASITLTVNLRPTVTAQPANATICSGSIATFTVAGTGTGLTYQWQESVAAGPFLNIINGGAYAGATTAILTINPVTVAMNNNRYRCVLSGTCPPAGTANISNAATLTVNALPVVTVTPTSGCGGVAGINGLLLSTGSSAPPIPGSLTVNSGTIAVAIPDGPATWPQTLFPGVSTNMAVAGIPANATITGMSVKLNLTHTYIADMVIVLKAPNGAVLNLDANINKTGGAGANFVNTTISSTSSTPLSAGLPPYSGNFQPDAVGATYVAVGFTFPGGPTTPAGYIPTVSNFNGLYSTPNGTWSLGIYDWGAGDIGTLTNWEIKIDYTTPGGAGTPLTYTWSPAAGLYTNATATIPYVAGTQTPSVYAAPTVFTAYTVTGTDGTTGCSNTAIALVNYTPPAPTLTPSPVAMCLGDLAVKLKSTSALPATPAIWSPIAGLFSDAAASTAYVAGTPVDSVWTKPATAGVYNYSATVQSLPPAPSSISTNFAAGNGNFVITFNVRNNNTYAVNLTDISSLAFAAGASNVEAWYNATNISGSPGAITNANGWFQFGTAAITAIGGTTVQPFMSGLSLSIPAGATYRILVSCATTAGGFNMGYSTLAAGTYTFSSGGCDIITGDNIGYGGGVIPTVPGNVPRGFIGTVRLSTNVAACTSPARTVVVTVNTPTTISAQPVNQTICTDKIASFTVAASGSGPFTYQWQESINGGTTWTNITNGGVYSGATTATLIITGPPVSMNGNFYRCIVTGAAPCASITTAQRLLTVNPLPVIVISANPRRLLPGMTTTFTSTVNPNAAGPGGYAWLRNGAVLSSSSLGVNSGIGTGSINVNVDGLGDYSLRVTDVFGCTSTSNVISITDSASGKCFIYPNPNSGMFQVRYYSAANNVLPRMLTVYDAKGDQVLTKTYTIGRPYDRMDVDLRRNGKGLYWVEIGDMNGKRLTMCRVVIQ